MSHNPELVKQLAEAEIEYDGKTINEVLSLVNELKIGTEDLVNEWEAFAYNNKNDAIDATTINPRSFKIFSKHLRQTQSAKILKKSKSRSQGIHNVQTLKPLMENISKPNATNNSNNKSMDNQLDSFLSMTTPSKTRPNKQQIISSANILPQQPSQNIMQSPAFCKQSSSTTSQRRKGDRISVLNGDLQSNKRVKHVDIVSHDAIGDVKSRRFMFEDVHTSQMNIKDRIEFIGDCLLEQIQECESMDDIGYNGVDEPSQREFFYLGRIMNDGDNSGSDKITNGNVVLESDVNLSYAMRIKLDLTQCAALSLFPGQIVAIKGINSSGKEIVVSKIYQNASAKLKQVFDEQKAVSAKDESLKIMVACGPFTARNSVEFKHSPLCEFGKQVVAQKPNIVLLMGPFTDSDNEMIRKNDLQCTLHELFEHLLSAFISFVGSEHLDKIMLVPSTRDVHHFSPFPQPKYALNALSENESNILLMNNPTQFSVNNVSFGVCSADFLWDACKMGLTKNINDRLLSMMSHCIEQRNFYPLQPADSALRMDYNHCNALHIRNELDLLIMPSKLKQFAKVYAETKTICINPSFLTRGNSGGTYAMISILQSDDYQVEDYSDKIRVDILRV